MGRSLRCCNIHLLQSKAKRGNDSVFLQSTVTPQSFTYSIQLSFSLIWICLCKHNPSSPDVNRFFQNLVDFKGNIPLLIHCKPHMSGVKVWSRIAVNLPTFPQEASSTSPSCSNLLHYAEQLSITSAQLWELKMQQVVLVYMGASTCVIVHRQFDSEGPTPAWS